MLVDKTIGQLVEYVDNKTVLTMSADHPLRIAELSARAVGRALARAVFQGRFTLDVLDGRVRNPQETLEVLEAN
jgi:hypothetical protein